MKFNPDSSLIQIVPKNLSLIDQLQACINAGMATAWIDGKMGASLVVALPPAYQWKIREQGLDRTEPFAKQLLNDILVLILADQTSPEQTNE